MTTEEKKQVRRKYALVMIPSLALLGTGGMVKTSLSDVARMIETTGQAVVAVNESLKTPQPVNCTSTFSVKPVEVK